MKPRQPDLFDTPATDHQCETCLHLKGPPVGAGVLYCDRWAIWCWKTENINCGTYAAKPET